MIRKDVMGQVSHGALVGSPALTKSGNTTMCRYEIGSGSLRMTVVEASTNAGARTLFDRLDRRSPDSQLVPNLGSAAFVRADGTTVTIKDNKVLTVDPTRLPAGNDNMQIAESLSFEVLTCWTG